MQENFIAHAGHGTKGHFFPTAKRSACGGFEWWEPLGSLPLRVTRESLGGLCSKCRRAAENYLVECAADDYDDLRWERENA